MSAEAEDAGKAMAAARETARREAHELRQEALRRNADVAAELRERRRHGLIARHRAKLARRKTA